MRGVFGGACILFLACASFSPQQLAAEYQRMEILKRQGLGWCSPVQLARAEAHLEFAGAEQSRGHMRRARAHFQQAQKALAEMEALERSDCHEGPPNHLLAIEGIDSDGDAVLDSEDACPRLPGPASNQGCPEEALGDNGDSVSVSPGPIQP